MIQTDHPATMSLHIMTPQLMEIRFMLFREHHGGYFVCLDDNFHAENGGDNVITTAV